MQHKIWLLTGKCLPLQQKMNAKHALSTIRRLLPLIIIFILACEAGMAQTADSLRLQKLQKDMYRHYSKHETKAFMETTEALKALAKKMGDEKAYYKAWGNQAVYGSTYISRSQAIETAKEILKHAETRKSQYGIYTANYVLGTIYTSLAQLEDASDRYTEALDILKHHYPEESLSALYLAITKIDRALGKHEKVKEYTDYVLADPKARLQHKLSALSYRYMVETDSKAAVEDRDMTYRKREEMKRRLGHDDNFGYIIDFEHALLHDDFDWAQRIVDSLPEGQLKTTKALYRSKLAARKGDWREAYEWQARYKRLYDSTNNDRVKRNSLDMGMALDKAKAENEANALRLAKLEEEAKNREQQTRNKQLEDEAMAMRIALQQTRLHEMEAQRESDSLMAYNKDLQMSEMESQMAARESEEHIARTRWIAGGVLAVVAMLIMIGYANIRRLQLLRLKEAYDKLEETTAAKERIESELRIAREIQMAMLPHVFPQSKRLDFYAQMMPAKEVGGDLYDFVVAGDWLYFCLGDVSGKGVPAALFMSMSTRLFRTLCKHRLKPAEIANRMNEELVQNNDSGMFVTMFIGLLNLENGRLDFCNAGHNPPLLDGEFIPMESNAPLGLWEELEYEGETIEDISGKQLFVYSDGLNEAENSEQKQYSDDRLQDFIQEHRNMAAKPLADLLMEDVERHVDGADPSDDLTMLCLRKLRN